jgi:hypothetical protein
MSPHKAAVAFDIRCEDCRELSELRVHLRRHRALITATRLTAIPLTDIRAMGIRATRSRASGTAAMVTLATRDTPLTRLLRAMDTQPTQDSQLTPPRVMDRQAIRDTPPTPDPQPLRRQTTQDSPLTPVASGYGFQGPPPNSPYSGSGYGNPVAGYPGDRPSED